jgi:hypothetical protein
MSDGKPYGLWGSGGGGKTSVLMYTRWMAKISALYQLPYGFDISGTFQAREGWKIPHSFSIFMNDAPNPGYRWTGPVYTGAVTADSLPAFSNLTLRLEKRIVVGRGRAYLMADCFNVLNAAIPVRAYEASYGAVYLDGGVQYDSWANPTNRAYAEILNPRIFRFGLRFEF